MYRWQRLMTTPRPSLRLSLGQQMTSFDGMSRLWNLLLITAFISGGCNFTYKIKSGAEAFEVKQYALAVSMLAEEYQELPPGPAKAEKAFMTGLAYEYMNNASSAVEWFAQAAVDNYGPEAYVKYAENLTILEEYEEAIGAYEQVGAMTNDPIAYRAEITTCKQAQQWKEGEAKSEYLIRPASFNSPGADYSPYVMGPDVVLFTSDRQGEKDEVYNWTGRGFSDIYIAHLGTNRVESFDEAINSPDNEGTVAMTSDRNAIYFSRCFDSGSYDMHCKIVMASKQGPSWSEPEVLSFNSDDINYGHPTLTANDSVMIFSCNDPEGYGGYDLYVSQLTEEGWSEPVNLSPRINTPGDEKFPSLYRDTLFFSSNHHVGMGGLDIFVSRMKEDGSWGKAKNLGYPIIIG